MKLFRDLEIESPAVINAYKQYPLTHYSRWRAWYQWIVVKCLTNPYLWLRYRPVVLGKQHGIPKSPFMVVSNHISMLDITLLNYAVDAPICFMAKKELFKHPLAAWFFKSQGSFAVDREQPDRLSIKNALNILRSTQGWNLAIFPEGTRSPNGRLQPFKPGFATLAQKTGVPILPVTIYKNAAGRIHLVISPAITDTRDPKAVTEQTYQVIQSQLPQSIWGECAY